MVELVIRTVPSVSSAEPDKTISLAVRPAQRKQLQMQVAEQEEDEFEYDHHGQLRSLPFLIDFEDLIAARRIDKGLKETLLSLRVSSLDFENWAVDLALIAHAVSEGSWIDQSISRLRSVVEHEEAVRTFHRHHASLQQHVHILYRGPKEAMKNINRIADKDSARAKYQSEQVNTAVARQLDELRLNNNEHTPASMSRKDRTTLRTLQRRLSAQEKQVRIRMDRYETLKSHIERLQEEHEEMTELVVAALRKKDRWEQLDSDREHSGYHYHSLQA